MVVEGSDLGRRKKVPVRDDVGFKRVAQVSSIDVLDSSELWVAGGCCAERWRPANAKTIPKGKGGERQPGTVPPAAREVGVLRAGCSVLLLTIVCLLLRGGVSFLSLFCF